MDAYMWNTTPHAISITRISSVLYYNKMYLGEIILN